MSSTTNTAINSRSMNGVITITDGEATLENGDLNCNDITSDTLNTTNLISTIFTCNGEIRSNLVGPYTIPVSTSALTGSLISYGNTSNSGATDFTNYGSTYNLLKQGFYFNNINSTTTLTNLAIIDNSQTYFKSQLVGCTAETPLNTTSIVNKTYCDSNFVDRVNTLTQNINGLKTFTNNTNFTSTILARTNIKLSEYENSPSSNNVTLTFPMPETIALRTTSSTNNPMTITLPALTNNERGYVFTFNKLFTTFGNFSATFQTSGGNAIYTLFDQITGSTSNTTLLSIDKIQCKLAVGFFGTTNYWVEQTDFSTYDRFKLQEWQNATQTNSLTLTFPLPPTIALRASTQSMMTITLPTLTTNDRGKIFTFLKINTFKFDVTFNTSSSQWIFPLNNLNGIPTTNTSIFPSTKITTRLVVAWFGTATYWVEVGDYSTFDKDENNLIYPRLAIGNTFTNTNIFTAQATFDNSTPICSVAIPTAINHLTRKDYCDNTFVDRVNSLAQGINGIKTFSDNVICSVASPTAINHLTRKDYCDNTFVDRVNSLAQGINGIKTFSDNVICSVASPTLVNHLTRKDYVDNNFVDKSNPQTIYGYKIFGSRVDLNGTTSLVVAGIAQFDGTTNFTTSLPTCSITATTSNQLVNYTTLTSQGYITSSSILSASNAWTGSNSFNLILPTSTITANSANQLVNYTTLTSQNYTTLPLVQGNSNTFTATNTFNGNLVSATGLIVKDSSLSFQKGAIYINVTLNSPGDLHFLPYFPSNSYRFQCLDSTATADKSIYFTFLKTTIETQLEVAENATFNGGAVFNTVIPTTSLNASANNQIVNWQTLNCQNYTTLPLVQGNANTFTNTNNFTGDVTLSKTKNNSTYATYNGLNSTYIGYMAEVPTGIYLGIGSGVQYQLGAITLDSTNVGFWTCNYEVEINCSTAGSISKIFVFVSSNLVSTTVPIGLPGAKANNFSTQTYAVGDSTYHSGSFSFLQSTTTVIYGVQLISIVASGGFQRKGQIRMLRIL